MERYILENLNNMDFMTRWRVVFGVCQGMGQARRQYFENYDFRKRYLTDALDPAAVVVDPSTGKKHIYLSDGKFDNE
jgi:hypothetical protein